MCIEFVKKQDDYDFFSEIVNFTANAAIVTLVSAASAMIASTALKALGYNDAAIKVTRVLSFSATAIGASGVVLGLGMLAFLAHTIHNSLEKAL